MKNARTSSQMKNMLICSMLSLHVLQSALMLPLEFLKMYLVGKLPTVHNISFLPTILELYSEIVLCRKPFGIGHTYIYTFLLRMPDTMTSRNISLSAWDNLYSVVMVRNLS
jgi:hypothetical protein